MLAVLILSANSSGRNAGNSVIWCISVGVSTLPFLHLPWWSAGGNFGALGCLNTLVFQLCLISRQDLAIVVKQNKNFEHVFDMPRLPCDPFLLEPETLVVLLCYHRWPCKMHVMACFWSEPQRSHQVKIVFSNWFPVTVLPFHSMLSSLTWKM